MSYFKDIAGQRFGMLVVTDQWKSETIRGAKISFWYVKCDCGKEKWMHAGTLHAGKGRSCGCVAHRIFRDNTIANKPWLKANAASTKHGGHDSPEYRSWEAMIQRCTNPKHVSFKNYGGRGITIHPSFRDFATFLAEVGPRPTPQHSIDRKDSNGNYEPGNLRWATKREQQNNRRHK